MSTIHMPLKSMKILIWVFSIRIYCFALINLLYTQEKPTVISWNHLETNRWCLEMVLGGWPNLWPGHRDHRRLGSILGDLFWLFRLVAGRLWPLAIRRQQARESATWGWVAPPPIKIFYILLQSSSSSFIFYFLFFSE